MNVILVCVSVIRLCGDNLRTIITEVLKIDWKKFIVSIPEWQERYISKLNQEFKIALII